MKIISLKWTSFSGLIVYLAHLVTTVRNGDGAVPRVDGEGKIVGAAGQVQRERVEQGLKTDATFLPEVVLEKVESVFL
jgi:hypothetical protein